MRALESVLRSCLDGFCNWLGAFIKLGEMCAGSRIVVFACVCGYSILELRWSEIELKIGGTRLHTRMIFGRNNLYGTNLLWFLFTL